MKKFGMAALVGMGALLLGGVGAILQHQSTFSRDYVQSQMKAQRINFLTLESLTEDQKKQTCLVENAGKAVLTGAQAECYANKQIAPDLARIAGGKTYSEMSYPAKLARDKVIAATAADPNDPAIAKLAAEATRLEAPALTLFRGETLRGLLLTTFGFSRLGMLGGTTANVLFVLSGVLLVAAVVVAAVTVRTNEKSESRLATRGPVTPVGVAGFDVRTLTKR